MKRLIAVPLLLGFLAVGIAPAASVDLGRCSMGTAIIPPENFITVLAYPTPDSLLAELSVFDWYDWAGDSFTPQAAPSDSTWGQVFQTVEVAGPDSLAAELAGADFVAVPWAYDAACHPIPWDSSAVWVEGEPQVFFLRKSRRAGTVHGLVFDVLGWHSPYPRASFLRFATPDSIQKWMKAEDYFRFLNEIDLSGEAESKLGSVSEWEEANPSQWGFPASELKRRYVSWLSRHDP